MANSGFGGNQLGESFEIVKEVVRDVKDSVGEMIEQGVQSVSSSNLTPQQFQQSLDSARDRKLEDQKQLAEARRKIEWYKKLEQEQKKVREANKQKETQRLQAQQQKEQAKKIQVVKLQQTPKKPGELPQEVLRTQVEIKTGKGIGG
ncbi:hypothetical protein HY384_03345 [Candidatus Daviesbacteria bacterium]|nr:hypothetical protein [Candidatus Daviesbacteria bacterium]